MMPTIFALPKKLIDVRETFDPFLIKETEMMGIEQIINTINECAAFGAEFVMRREEEKKGYKVLEFGDYGWFKKSDWEESVISQNANQIRIVAIIAKNPGAGAFSRMVTEICACGLTPVVVTPLPEMEAILSRWGWQWIITAGTYAERESQWWPTQKWMKERVKL